MASFNRVVLMGNLTRNIELKYTPGGLAVAEMGLAINNKRKNHDGNWVDEVCYVDVTLFGRTAEVASEYVSKGSPIFVEGRLKYDSWEKDGQKRNRLTVVGEKIQLIGGPPPSNGSSAQSGSSAARSAIGGSGNRSSSGNAGSSNAGSSNSDGAKPPAPAAVRESQSSPHDSGNANSRDQNRTNRSDSDPGRGEAQPTGDGSGYEDPDIPF